MQTLTIDLKTNPDVAAVVADLEPGTGLTIKASIKALDEQTLTVTLEEVEAPEAEVVDEVEVEDTMVPDADDEERL
jgi:hypothetical protein